MKYNYLFGPVPSRRLGVSLGIDLVPFKTCTLDCVYCECGETTLLTNERKEYVPAKAVIAELEKYLSDFPRLDYITFSGSGEPTLNSEIGTIVEHLKSNYPRYKLCLLTNGTLFSNIAVRSAVKKIDMIIPSLDAASEAGFKAINRPHKDIQCRDVITGLIKLREHYRGTLMMEIFIVPGLNDSVEDLALIKKTLTDIKPDRVQVGTLDRPGTENWVQAVDSRKLKEIADYLGQAELIEDFTERENIASYDSSLSEQIIQTISRRPCTVKDLIQVTGKHQSEIEKYIEHSLKKGIIEVDRMARGTFFRLKK